MIGQLSLMFHYSYGEQFDWLIKSWLFLYFPFQVRRGDTDFLQQRVTVFDSASIKFNEMIFHDISLSVCIIVKTCMTFQLSFMFHYFYGVNSLTDRSSHNVRAKCNYFYGVNSLTDGSSHD